jgi:hypothetical protein
VLASPSDASTLGDQLPGPAPQADRRTVPTANEDGLVVPDALGVNGAAGSSQRRNTDGPVEASTAAKSSAGARSLRTRLGRLLSSFSTASRRWGGHGVIFQASPKLGTTIKSTSIATWRTHLHGVGGLRHRADAATYVRPAIVTCLELCCPYPGVPVSGPAPSDDSLARPGCPATQCERDGGPSAPAGTPNAESAPLGRRVDHCSERRRSSGSACVMLSGPRRSLRRQAAQGNVGGRVGARSPNLPV